MKNKEMNNPKTETKVEMSSTYGTFADNKKKETNDYSIGVVGKKNTYGDGAIRYIKDKGRFDLIPEDVVPRILDKLDELLTTNYSFDSSSEAILRTAYEHDFLTTIILLNIKNYFSPCEICKFDDNVVGNNMYRCSDLFIRNFCRMLQDLAKHFQKGAEVYGERNCQKGLPADSFIDSGLRHLGQYLSNVRDDENHFISAIWNFWMYDWTINQKKNVLNSNPKTFVLDDQYRVPRGNTTPVMDSGSSHKTKHNSYEIKTDTKFYIKSNTDEAQAMLQKASDLMAGRISLPMNKLSILFDVLRDNEITVCHDYEDFIRYGVSHKGNKFNSPIQLKPTGVYGNKILELYSKLCTDDISQLTVLNDFMRSHNAILILKYLSELNMSIVFDKGADEKETDIKSNAVDYLNELVKSTLDELKDCKCEADKIRMEKVISTISSAVDKTICDLDLSNQHTPYKTLDLSPITNLVKLTSCEENDDENGEIIEV